MKRKKPEPEPKRVVQNPVIENLLEIDALMTDVGVFCGVKWNLDVIYERVKSGKGTSSDKELIAVLEDATSKIVKMMNVLKIK